MSDVGVHLHGNLYHIARVIPAITTECTVEEIVDSFLHSAERENEDGLSLGIILEGIGVGVDKNVFLRRNLIAVSFFDVDRETPLTAWMARNGYVGYAPGEERYRNNHHYIELNLIL